MPLDGSKSDELISAETVVLMRAADRISNPKRWCVGTARRSWRGLLFYRQYCVLGALDWACRNYDLVADDCKAADLLNRAARRRGYASAAVLNDHPNTTHADVMALLEDAIEASVGVGRSAEQPEIMTISKMLET